MHITPRIENVLIKSKSVLKCWDCWLSDDWVDKTVLNLENGALWDFTQKLEVPFDFPEKHFFFFFFFFY